LLIEKDQLDKTQDEFGKMNFENILGLFKSKKLVNEKDWLLLSKLRLDRNVGGHYLSDRDALIRKETEQQAEMTIKLAMPLLKKFHKHLDRASSQKLLQRRS